MVDVVVCGVAGRMGQRLANLSVENDDLNLAGGTEHAAVVAGDQPVDDPAVGPERAECRFLVHVHEPAVADHVGGEDSRKPSLNLFFRHRSGFSRLCI